MVYRGRVSNGVVVLDERDGTLPDGMLVTVYPVGLVAAGVDAAPDDERDEEVDRLLGVLRRTDPAGMEAQQKLDRVL